MGTNTGTTQPLRTVGFRLQDPQPPLVNALLLVAVLVCISVLFSKSVEIGGTGS